MIWADGVSNLPGVCTLAASYGATVGFRKGLLLCGSSYDTYVAAVIHHHQLNKLRGVSLSGSSMSSVYHVTCIGDWNRLRSRNFGTVYYYQPMLFTEWLQILLRLFLSHNATMMLGGIRIVAMRRIVIFCFYQNFKPGTHLLYYYLLLFNTVA
jgi:hypothetical protein